MDAVQDAIAKAREAERLAQSAVHDLERRAREEKSRAAAEIDMRHKDELSALYQALRAAREAVVAAQDLSGDHPWTGKRVFRMEAVGSRWERRPDRRIEGLVETMRSSTRLPDNTPTYRRPAIGQGLVRLLKIDGTPGARFEVLESYKNWQLVESEALA